MGSVWKRLIPRGLRAIFGVGRVKRVRKVQKKRELDEIDEIEEIQEVKEQAPGRSVDPTRGFF
jgi:hypothetical protein